MTTYISGHHQLWPLNKTKQKKKNQNEKKETENDDEGVTTSGVYLLMGILDSHANRDF